MQHTLPGAFARFSRTIVRVVAPALLLSVPVWSQEGQGQGLPTPEEVGQWAGPYQLAVDDDGDPQTPKWVTHEIVHALLLPPAGPGEPQTDRVLLQAATGGGCLGCSAATINQFFGRTYRWLSRAPSNVTMVPPAASYPQDGTQDFFCGGHLFLPDGDVMWLGGTDKEAQCNEDCESYEHDDHASGLFGHQHAWRLDVSTWMPTWQAATSPTNKMAFPRWYPQGTLIGNTVFVHGHTSKPNVGQDQWREELDLATGAWSSASNDEWTVTCDSTARVPLIDYPRLHLLSKGELIWGSAFSRTPDAGLGWLYFLKETHFLDVKPQPWSCPTERWREGPTANALRINGSSVHFITWDPALVDFTEVIYAVGGAERSIGGNPASCSVPENQGVVHASVEKIVDPSGGGSAAWQSAPSMSKARVNHNTVILLDGSMVAIGGMDIVDDDCTYVLRAERYRPPEVFTELTGPDPGWELLPKQLAPRQYHSTALLLPDGRVGSFGGRNLPGDTSSGHTAEIYSPFYVFHPNRPEIDEFSFEPAVAHAALDAFVHEQEVQFEVVSETPVRRVALVRNGSSTHAFDNEQRYVELRITQDLQLPDGRREVKVLMPEDEYQAPLGYYLLTVLDENGLPSPGVWVRLKD